ncbi:MAG TPA: ABC transporter permease [Vicinamibacterales bacterium]|nr:ABC transporter permease [Vicinamibacterales bacterium]
MRPFLSRLASLFRQARLDARLDEEVQFHLDMLAQEYVRRGLSEADARRAARRAFGGVTQMKESYRDQRGLPLVETIAQDARYGVRSLLRTPGFTFAALLTLALGIGANSAIFSVVNAVLIRPLPYADPDRIVTFGRMVRGAQHPQENMDGRRYLFYREHLQSVDALAAWSGVGFNLATDDGGEYVLGRAVSSEYFAVFTGRPLHGSTFTREHDAPGGPAEVVLSHGLWQRQFGGNPGALGATIRLADQPYRVIGVLPSDYAAMSTGPVDVYIPLRPATSGRGGGFNYIVAGRLKAGVTLQQANEEAQAAFQAFREEFPNLIRNWDLGVAFRPYHDTLSRGARPALLLMLAAVGTLLLIACANTASLLLARATGRGREIAVRAALGANRVRIVRQLLTESVVLSLTGAVAGLLLAYWSVPALLTLLPPSFPIYQEVRVDATVLAATFAIALLTGLLFGLAPAVSLSRRDLVDAFKDDATRTTSSRRSAWLRKGLVVGEVALCMLLLIGAGLLLQTFMKMRAIDPGFDVRGLMTARMSLQGERYSTTEALNRYVEQGLDRLRRIPGVESAALVNGLPIERGLNLNVTIPDGPLQGSEKVENATTDWRFATHDYFKTMGIEIVAGRGFDERDTSGAPRVVVVNEEFVTQFFRGQNPLGYKVTVLDTDPPMEIVGVARNVREAGLVGPMVTLMYVPITQASEAAIRISNSYFPVSWVVRSRAPGGRLVEAMRQELRAIDPQQPVSAFRSMEEIKGAQFQAQRFQMTLLVLLASIGLLLAAAGIYGLISYAVSQRTREFGIRLALGARPGAILRSIVAQGALLACIGVALGSAAAAYGTRALQTFLFGVSTNDPLTFAAVGALLVIVAATASLVPAFRAVRLNPVAALRE